MACGMAWRATLTTTTRPRGQIGIDADGQRIIEAVGLPGERKAPHVPAADELGRIEAQVILDIGIDGPGDEAAHEAEPLVALKRLARAADKRVLAHSEGPTTRTMTPGGRSLN